MVHGTRAGYNNGGCRCEKCTAANAAHNWAERQSRRWDAPLADSLRAPESYVFIGSTVTLPSRLIVEAVRRYEHKIKVDALSLFWHERRKGG